PAASTCSSSPASLTPGINSVSTTLTVTTTAPAAAAPFDLRQPGDFPGPLGLAGCLSLLLLAVLHRRGAARRMAFVGAAAALILFLGSCGGSGGGGTTKPQNGTPPGIASVTFNGTSS